MLWTSACESDQRHTERTTDDSRGYATALTILLTSELDKVNVAVKERGRGGLKVLGLFRVGRDASDMRGFRLCSS